MISFSECLIPRFIRACHFLREAGATDVALNIVASFLTTAVQKAYEDPPEGGETVRVRPLVCVASIVFVSGQC